MYEADYEENVSSLGKRLSERCRKMELLTDEELEQILVQMDEGFFSDYEKERFLAIIEQELEYREKMRNKKMGEFGRRSDEREDDEKENEEENEEVKDDNLFAGEGLSEENTEKSKGKGIFFGRNAKKKESKTLSEPDLKNKDTEESKTGSEEKSVLGTENKTIKECDKENIRDCLLYTSDAADEL